MMRTGRLAAWWVTVVLFVSLLVGFGCPAGASEDTDKDTGSDEPSLEEKVDILTEEISRLREQMNIPETDKELEAAYGMGPAASKVYGVSQGISFGGYGEFYFSSPSEETSFSDSWGSAPHSRLAAAAGRLETKRKKKSLRMWKPSPYR